MNQFYFGPLTDATFTTGVKLPLALILVASAMISNTTLVVSPDLI